MKSLLKENPTTVIAPNKERLVGCDDPNSIAILYAGLSGSSEKEWFVVDARGTGRSAFHIEAFPSLIRKFKENPLIYLKGRIWPNDYICSFYENEQICKGYTKEIEEVFKLLKLNIDEFGFDFADSSKRYGLLPWGNSKPSEKVEIPVDIQQRLNDLTARIHMTTGVEKQKIEREIEDIYKDLGVKNSKNIDKKSFFSTRNKKILPRYGGYNSYAAGKHYATMGIAEEKVRLYNSTLNPEFWNEDKTLKPEIRNTLLKIAVDFYTNTELKSKLFDVYFLGSGANYNWTPTSDLDLHLVMDGKQLGLTPELTEKFFRSLSGKWNLEHDVKIKNHPVEVYIQDINEKNHATGVYSLIRNAWIKIPDKEKISVDKKLIQNKYSMWVERINDAVSRKDEKQLKSILDSLKKYRQMGLDKSGEFSPENIVFKILRARNYIDKIKNCYNQIYDKKVSVKDGFDPLSQGPNEVDPEGPSDGFYKSLNNQMRKLEEEAGYLIGDCRDVELIDGIFGSVENFAQQVEDNGDEFIYRGIEVKYDPESDIHYFYQLNLKEVSKSDLKSRRPLPQALFKGDINLKQMTLDNLMNMRNKAARFCKAYKNIENYEMVKFWQETCEFFDAEIKKRLKYINEPVMENSQKNDYIGGVYQGEVKGMPVPLGKGKFYMHNDFSGLISGINSSNWRYDANKNQVTWNTQPNPEDEERVNRFFEKRGIIDPKHKTMYTYNENYYDTLDSDQGDEVANRYFSIGHDSGEKSNYCWIWDRTTNSIRAYAGGNHSLNFGYAVKDRTYSGWYDPNQNLISIVFPESELRKIQHKPTQDDIPNLIYQKLMLKFGKNHPKLVVFEGYGAGNPEDDPKHIKGKRWTIKFDSDSKILKENEDEFIKTTVDSILDKLFC